MKSNSLFLLTVALLATCGRSFIWVGFNNLTYWMGNDVNSCLQMLYYNVSGGYISFTEFGYGVQECGFGNLELTSFFPNDNLTNKTERWIDLNTSLTNPNAVSGMLTAQMVQDFNGTACVLLPQRQYPGIDLYLCQFVWNGLTIYIEIYGQWDLLFITTFNQDLLIPNYANNLSTPWQENITLYANPVDLSALSVGVASICTTANTTLPNLNGSVTVISWYDLRSTFANMTLQHVIIKPLNSSRNTTYISYPVLSTADVMLFNFSSISKLTSGAYCYVFPVHWAQLLSNMSYCYNGCDLEFVLMEIGLDPWTDEQVKNNFFLLKSSGFDTGNHTRPLPPNNTNLTNNNTQGTGGPVGTGSGPKSNGGNWTNNTIIVNSGIMLSSTLLAIILAAISALLI